MAVLWVLFSQILVRLQRKIEIINDMARRIAKVGAVTDTAQWQLSRLEAVGAERDYIMHHLNKALNMSEQELIRLFDEAATRSLAVDDAIYHAAGYNPQPLADNAYMQQLIRAGLVKTLEEYRNLTLTTAATATQQFENALDLAYHKVASGGFSYRQAIRDGIRSLTRKGLATIQYPTGWVDYMDVAFRRATLTGVNQTAAELQLQRMDEMDTDLVETTAHHGARTSPFQGPSNHAWWQGRWFSRSDKNSKYPNFYEQTGYGTGPGLCGWNCRHSFFPVIEGLSERAYDTQRLRELNSRTVNYDGKEMSLYDATQHQRYIERKIRRWK
ncbi:MAG: phage minor capsid protein, partial [Christensenella sp.]